MERKYYLRGLGIGIVVTAVIMGIALSDNGAMTDSEIIARAKELGMVENKVLSSTDSEEELQENTDAVNADESAGQNQTEKEVQDIAQTGQNEIKNNAAADDAASDDKVTNLGSENGEDTGEIDAESGLNAEEEETSTVADDAESGESEDDNINIAVGSIRVITVNSGDSSYTVAKKLADVGVVTSAETFDTFLCENGYDKRLRTGTFSIPADASDEQIARIVSGLE